MRADEAAVAALNAQLGVPGRHQFRDVALLILRRAARVSAVHRQRADRQLIAPSGHHRRGHCAHELGRVRGDDRRRLALGRHLLRQLYAVKVLQRAVDGRLVALHDLGAALAVGLGDRRLDPLDRLLALEHARDREKARLKHRIGPPGEARIARDLPRVDHVQLDLLGEDLLLNGTRERVPDAIRRLSAVEQQRRSRSRPLKHFVAFEQPEVVTADEARLRDKVRRADRFGPEAQMRDRLRAGLLGVVDEVALRVQALLGAEDLDRVLVRADRPVGTQAEEQRAHGLRRLDVERRVVGEARAGDIVVDPDREPPLGPLAPEFVEHAGDHPGRELLRGQPVAAADHARHQLALAICM